MKLQCQVEIINRQLSNANIRPNVKHSKSTLALGKLPKNDEYFIIHFSTTNKTGVRYALNSENVKKVFVKCLNEGKATIRFDNPSHDMCIKSEVIQLKYFMNMVKKCLSGEIKELQILNLSNIGVVAKDNAPKKLVILDRKNFPLKGLPRTLETLCINGIKMCNFRREILMLKQLTVLDLSNNEIEKLPPDLGRLPSLQELNLSNNKLGILGAVDWRWLLGPEIVKSLKLLDLSNNVLGELPKALWKIQNLVTLKLDDNLLEALPPSLGTMKQLKYLTASSNQIQYLPCSMLQHKLDYLDISNNRFANNQQNSDIQISQWDMFVKNLTALSCCAVLRNKLNYAPNIIPFTLVWELDDFSYCLCGSPVIDKRVYVYKVFEKKRLANSVVCGFNDGDIVLKCFFCSPRCFNKIPRI